MRSLTSGHLRAGIDSVRRAKVRSFWTMLGVIIGVASVITVVAIGEGIKQQISGQIHHLGYNLITVRPAELHAGNDNNGNAISGLNVSGTLGTKDITVVSHTAGVAASAPLTIVGNSAQADHPYSGGFVIGTTGDLPGLLNQSLAYGNFFDDSDSGNNVAVLGQHASEVLFNEDVPLGRSFIFHGQQFTVRGIFNQFESMPLGQEVDFDNAIFIPNDVAESLSNNTAPTYEILARATVTKSTG
ncbi:MAG TPA: ABC transporter permease, partial [Candidatus Dormibacteraeota bacterium]|nr:ABC transporter permease [Candidatus Dormibacteraeota bacterium]